MAQILLSLDFGTAFLAGGFHDEPRSVKSG
jgi:hypothetical protein